MTINILTLIVALFPILYNVRITPANTPDFTIGINLKNYILKKKKNVLIYNLNIIFQHLHHNNSMLH